MSGLFGAGLGAIALNNDGDDKAGVTSAPEQDLSSIANLLAETISQPDVEGAAAPIDKLNGDKI